MSKQKRTHKEKDGYFKNQICVKNIATCNIGPIKLHGTKL
jgi:hypothetical protein